MQGPDYTYDDSCPVQVLGLIQSLMFCERVDRDIRLLKIPEIGKALQQRRRRARSSVACEYPEYTVH
jgi:uncharacterized protein YcsI (UPF0317 family)